MYRREEARKNGVQNLLVEEDNEEIQNSAWKPQRVGVAKEEFKVPNDLRCLTHDSLIPYYNEPCVVVV